MAADLEELIRTGQIDITTREAVEDERDRSARAAEPGAYALTYEEHIDILRANNVIETVLVQNNFAEKFYISDSLTLSPDIIAKIKEALRRHGLDPDPLHALATRILSRNWYVLLLSQHYAPDKEGKPGFFLLANVDGETKRGILTVEDFPSIYDGSTHAAQKKALHLPDNAGLLHSVEHSILSNLLEICSDSENNGQMSLFQSVTIIKPERVDYPIDKVNNTVWGLLERDMGGQIKLKAERNGSKKEINILYTIDFDALSTDLKITRKLTPYDKRVYIAVAALFNAGNEIITLTQIHLAMGNTGRPNTDQLDKIDNAVTKMTSARILVDNREEIDAQYGYPSFRYDGSLLPFERATRLVNGQVVEAAIHIFREPPLVSFARGRKQITTVDLKLLQSPINKTDANLMLEDYLIDRISHMKRNGKLSRKMLFLTIYENCKIAKGKPRERAPGKIKRYLDHYKKTGFISRYTETKDGVTVFFDDLE